MKITIATLVVFTVEIALTCYGKPDYLNSFYFWLDIVATVSIITDICASSPSNGTKGRG